MQVLNNVCAPLYLTDYLLVLPQLRKKKCYLSFLIELKPLLAASFFHHSTPLIFYKDDALLACAKRGKRLKVSSPSKACQNSNSY